METKTWKDKVYWLYVSPFFYVAFVWLVLLEVLGCDPEDKKDKPLRPYVAGHSVFEEILPG